MADQTYHQEGQQLIERGTAMEIQSVPGHISVQGNKKTDQAAKEVMERAGT